MLSLFRKNILFCSSFIQKMSQSLLRAERVQKNVLEQNYAIQMQTKIRKKVDIDSHISSLQKQMNQQIARQLKKSQDKVQYFIKKAQKSYQQLGGLGENQKIKRSKQIKQHNTLIEMCEKSRWEFLVHRQSCGFTIKNYQLVHSMYQIPPRISTQ